MRGSDSPHGGRDPPGGTAPLPGVRNQGGGAVPLPGGQEDLATLEVVIPPLTHGRLRSLHPSTDPASGRRGAEEASRRGGCVASHEVGAFRLFPIRAYRFNWQRPSLSRLASLESIFAVYQDGCTSRSLMIAPCKTLPKQKGTSTADLRS